jgi:uncharacterized protein (TIGR00251 family)
VAVIKNTPSGVEIAVRVIPRAPRTESAGERDGRLLVRVAAPPVDGAANDALVVFFSTLLEVPSRAVRLVAGGRARQKRVAVAGVDAAHVGARLTRRGRAG